MEGNYKPTLDTIGRVKEVYNTTLLKYEIRINTPTFTVGMMVTEFQLIQQ